MENNFQQVLHCLRDVFDFSIDGANTRKLAAPGLDRAA